MIARSRCRQLREEPHAGSACVIRIGTKPIRIHLIPCVVQTLVERELIEVCGAADAPGRPRLYRPPQVSPEPFGLKGLGELPAADELRRIQVELATVPADDSQEELPLDKKTDEADDDPDETDSEDDE